MLRLCVIGASVSFLLPYKPDLPLCIYLRRVIMPRLESHKSLLCYQPYWMRDDDGNAHSVRGLMFMHKAADKDMPTVVFDYKNRMLKLGDVIPPNGTISGYPEHLRRKLLQGNASLLDVDAECAICMEPGPNYQLHCKHAFHRRCLARYEQERCCLCRRPFHFHESFMRRRYLLQMMKK